MKHILIFVFKIVALLSFTLIILRMYQIKIFAFYNKILKFLS